MGDKSKAEQKYFQVPALFLWRPIARKAWIPFRTLSEPQQVPFWNSHPPTALSKLTAHSSVSTRCLFRPCMRSFLWKAAILMQFYMFEVFNWCFTPPIFLFLNQASPQTKQDLCTAPFASELTLGQDVDASPSLTDLGSQLGCTLAGKQVRDSFGSVSPLWTFAIFSYLLIVQAEQTGEHH